MGWIAVDMGFRFPGDKFQAVANSFQAHDQMVEALGMSHRVFV